MGVWFGLVEAENPGLLPFDLTLEDLPLGMSKLRNRVPGPNDPKRRYLLALD